MITAALILALQITAIFVVFTEGMLLGWLRIFFANVFDRCFGKRLSRYIQKPLWDCLPCMASVWTIVLTGGVNVKLILAVSGILCIVSDKLISD